MTRLWTLLVLGAVALLLTPAAASAQFGRPFGSPFGRPGGAPIIVPSANPFFYVPKYRYTQSFRVTAPTLFGSTSIGLTRTSLSVNPLVVIPPRSFSYAQGGSYLTGGTNRPDLVQAAQRDLQRAQREATRGAKDAIERQWNYERGDAAAPGPAPLSDPIRVALDPTDRAQITSGEALNALLPEVVRAEATGAKGPSAYVPPLLLEDIRSGGPPAADLLNLARRAGALDFPPAFDAPELAAARDQLEKDFAAVAAVVQEGRSPEAAKVAQLERSFGKFRDAAAPVVKNLSFEDAADARRFLNRVASAVKALKTGAADRLIDPKWTAEGLTVAELVRHMNRHKLQFGPAPQGGDEAYVTTHRNLATYLFVLKQAKK